MGCNASAQTVVPDDAPKPQQYQWYWQCWDEKVEYPADVRDRLEKAYTDFQAGRGPTYPMIQVGDDGDTVSLKAMQQISKTGIKRNVVRETTGPDRAAAWYYGSPKRCAGAEVPFDEGECDRLEEAYAAFQQGGAHTIKVDEDREVSLSKMRLRHMITGVRRAVVREALPEKYEWSCTKGERTPYAADVRDRLEGAYFELQQGRGASFPTVAVGGGNTVHLKTLQQMSGTGVTRDVVRVVDSNPQQYRWYCDGTLYGDDVRDKLEAAYQLLQSGGGPTYPTVPLGDDGEISLKAMQQISKTGIKRDVVREGDGPDRAARWYSVTEATGSVYDADESERLEAAYASDQVEVAVGDRTIDLQRMQQISKEGVVRDLVREKLPREYRWSCAGDELTPYDNEARAKLEDAYAAFRQGRGPTYPTVAVGGDCEVSLKTMTSRHARTGVQRDVVRELEHDRPVVPPPDNTLAREASSVKLQATQRGRAARKAGLRAAHAAARLQAIERGRLVRTKRRAVAAHIRTAAGFLVVQRRRPPRSGEGLAATKLQVRETTNATAEEEAAAITAAVVDDLGRETDEEPAVPRAPATLTRAASVRSAEAEWRKARDVIRAIPHAHAPMSRALQRLVEQREAAFRDEARRDAEAEDEAARRRREEEEAAAEEARRRHQEAVMTRVLTRLVKRKLGDAVETWCVGLAERKSWLSRTTTTAPDSFATTGIFNSTQSLSTTLKSRREEASSYLDEIMRSPSLSRASSARARSRGRAASPEKSLRLADWNFSPPPPDRVVRRTTPAYPYSPPVLKDLTSNPLGGSVRAATPARGRRSPSPTKQPDFRPRAVDAARKEGPPHQEEETSTVLTPRRSPSPPPVALGPPARPAPASPVAETEARPRSRSRSPERPKTAAPFYGPRSRLPERPRSASPVGRNPYSPRDRNSVEAGWNPCFNHVVVKNKPLDPQPYGPPPPTKPKAVRLDGVPQHLHPGSRRAAETAKKIKKYRRQRRRIAAEAEARVEALKERRAPWEASFAYPRGDAANRNAPRKQARPATAQPARATADAAKQRPATAGAGRSPIRVDLARPPESHPIRIEPPARQPGTRDHLADKKNSYRAKLAKPPRFGPKVHAAIAEEMYKTI